MFTPQVCVVSGTATGDISNTLRESGAVGFYTMSIPDDQMWPWIVNDLENGVDTIKPNDPAPTASWNANTEIIVLAEETAYGMIPLSHRDPGVPLSHPPVRKILFPLHISDLRTAFGKTQQATPAVPGVSHHDLPLTGEEGGQDEPDVVPAFSKRSVTYDELVLSNLLATIHRDRIRYVGIVATDVEDLVSLVHEIRNASPNTIIFTTNADIRYLHSDVNSDFDIFVDPPRTTALVGQKWHTEFPGRSQLSRSAVLLAI